MLLRSSTLADDPDGTLNDGFPPYQVLEWPPG